MGHPLPPLPPPPPQPMIQEQNRQMDEDQEDKDNHENQERLEKADRRRHIETRERSQDRSKDLSQDRSKDRSRDRSKDRSRDRSKDRTRDKSRLVCHNICIYLLFWCHSFFVEIVRTVFICFSMFVDGIHIGPSVQDKCSQLECISDLASCRNFRDCRVSLLSIYIACVHN